MSKLTKLIKWCGWFIKVADGRKRGATVLLVLVALVMGPQLLSAAAAFVHALPQCA